MDNLENIFWKISPSANQERVIITRPKTDRPNSIEVEEGIIAEEVLSRVRQTKRDVMKREEDRTRILNFLVFEWAGDGSIQMARDTLQAE